MLARAKGWSTVANSKEPIGGGWDWNPRVQVQVRFNDEVTGGFSKNNVQAVSMFLYHFESKGKTASLSGAGLKLADGIAELHGRGVEPGTWVRIRASFQSDQPAPMVVEVDGDVPIINPTVER